jgi:SAM-dependent methyltransferase
MKQGWKMDRWKYFYITHRDHVYCNPMSVEKFEELIALLRLGPEDRVLEIAAGKGEFLIRLAEQYDIEGTGVDLSPYFLSDARKKHQQRVPNARINFVEMDGAEYKTKAGEKIHLAACIGAGWIFGGHRGTLKALHDMAAPGGWVIVGEPYWRREPAAEYLKAIGEKRSAYGTHYENMQAGQELGLQLVYTLASSRDDWDRYEGLQWYAAHEWASGNPDDEDVEEVLQRVGENRENYLRWGRETFGWGIYVFKKEVAKE